MTTVINYNFFFLHTDSVFDDFRFRNPFAGKKHKGSPQEERVIDVTSESRVLNDEDNSIEINSDKTAFATRLASTSMLHTTYDRHGKMVRYFDAKGMYVSLKV